ncbi:hypothetical protein D3C73_1409470 [compost metagenome]
MLGFPHFADNIGFSDFNSNLNPCIFKEIIDVIVVRVIGIAIRINLLVRVALLPFQSDRDDWSTNVLCTFDVISSKDAQAAGIHFEVGMQAILHAEISDRR